MRLADRTYVTFPLGIGLSGVVVDATSIRCRRRGSDGRSARKSRRTGIAAVEVSRRRRFRRVRVSFNVDRKLFVLALGILPLLGFVTARLQQVGEIKIVLDGQVNLSVM